MDSIRSIVVRVDATAHAESRLQLAQTLARRCGARLTALYAASPAAFDTPFALAQGDALLLPAMADLDRERQATARALFDRVADPAARPTAVWVEAGSLPVYRAVAARALTADLLVLGQHDPAAPQTTFEADLVASTVIETGTPTLVLPHAGVLEPGALTRPDLSVLIAWKPSREAARAVRSALPWLRVARQVHVCGEAGDDAAGWPGVGALRGWLALQDVLAEAHVGVNDGDQAGEGLLSLAADVGAHLLVMGCYGHSRARELVLGGASRTVLRSMTLPTLMVH